MGRQSRAGWRLADFDDPRMVHDLDAAQFKELVGYIRASGAELMDLYDALDATGNVVEAGDYQKPGADAAEPFFVVDAYGRAWTNALENLRPADGITNVGQPCKVDM